MKFHIQRDKKVLWIRIENHENATLDFRRELSTEFEAQVVVRAITRAMADRIEAINKTAYERGWSDAKKRKPKLTYFSSCVNSREVGY